MSSPTRRSYKERLNSGQKGSNNDTPQRNTNKKVRNELPTINESILNEEDFPNLGTPSTIETQTDTQQAQTRAARTIEREKLKNMTAAEKKAFHKEKNRLRLLERDAQNKAKVAKATKAKEAKAAKAKLAKEKADKEKAAKEKAAFEAMEKDKQEGIQNARKLIAEKEKEQQQQLAQIDENSILESQRLADENIDCINDQLLNEQSLASQQQQETNSTPNSTHN